jgi:hypothetical protein
MSELLIGMLIGFVICWGIMFGTEAVFERRYARSEPEAHS